MWRDLHPAHLVVLDAALGELVDMEPEGIAEVADALTLLCLEELQRHGQNSMFPACSPKGESILLCNQRRCSAQEGLQLAVPCYTYVEGTIQHPSGRPDQLPKGNVGSLGTPWSCSLSFLLISLPLVQRNKKKNGWGCMKTEVHLVGLLPVSCHALFVTSLSPSLLKFAVWCSQTPCTFTHFQ